MLLVPPPATSPTFPMKPACRNSPGRRWWWERCWELSSARRRLYLVLKVGMTVSASIPVAVLSITLFRLFSRLFGFRPATILENNIVQTTGSAGESIAFGVGVTMPALMLLGLRHGHRPRDGRFDTRRTAGHFDDDSAAPGVHRAATRHAASIPKERPAPMC